MCQNMTKSDPNFNSKKMQKNTIYNICEIIDTIYCVVI